MQINANTVIPDEELLFKASRSSGPGGQNVNKVNTRVTLLFDVAASPSLTPHQKKRIAQKLATRMDKRGVLRIVSQKGRTQETNRQAARERFADLLAEALKRLPARKKTGIPAGARERRLKEKKQRSAIKQQRSQKNWRDE
jgi:ribosome-associated protein